MKLLFENWRGYLKEEYYELNPDAPPSIDEVMKDWQAGNKAYDPDSTFSSQERDYHAFYSVEELMPYREYDWGPAKHRGSQAEWDKLMNSIKKGFDPKQPLLVQVGKNGVAKIGEGNHRLAVANELGIEKVPVYFEFYHNVEVDPHSFRYVELPSKEGEEAIKAIADDPPEEIETAIKSPVDPDLVKQIMELF